MTRRTLARVAFLTVTAGAIAMELWYAFDGDKDTEPYTTLIVDYVPGPVTAAVILFLMWWVPTHFRDAYKRGRKPKT